MVQVLVKWNRRGGVKKERITEVANCLCDLVVAALIEHDTAEQMCRHGEIDVMVIDDMWNDPGIQICIMLNHPTLHPFATCKARWNWLRDRVAEQLPKDYPVIIRVTTH